MRLPSGTVTLVFTDIEGSTRLLARIGDRYAQVLAEHRRLLREAFAQSGGVEVDTQGDAFLVAFARAGDAVRAAVAAQRGLSACAWPDGARVRVRMGIHTGEPALSGEGYVGLDLHRGARICAAGHGGQVLASAATHALLSNETGDGVGWRDLGEHRLKDLPEPEHLFQVVADGLIGEFAPLKSLDSRPTNLPQQLPPLVGRRREIVELAALLASDRGRLVTLTGPGGSGKSRLSLAVAADWREREPGWAFVVRLAPVADPALVGATIVDTLGVGAESGEPPVDLLRRKLAGERVLLVLDNFEHLLPAAPLVAELSAACPQLTVLVTSRIPLHLSGELEYEVLPLPVDDAVDLFVERARGVGRTVTSDRPTADAIVAICARLDGLPLAIELAAVRTKLLSPVALLERLQSPLAMLTAGGRDRPERQQTIRATIDWSFRLLGEEEQRAMSALSVFAGGWSLDAAEAVAGASLDRLAELVDASLIRHRELDDGEPRFSMLQTIREYARERLGDGGRADDVARLHAQFFLDLVRDVVADPRAPRFESGLNLIEPEHDNIRAALGWAVEHDPLLAVELAGSFVWFWDTRGHPAEGKRWLQRALERGQDAPASSRARACFGIVRLASSLWHHADCAAAGEEALRLYRELDDAGGVAITLSHLALVQEAAGDLDGAAATSERALAVARTVPEDRWTLAVTLNNSAVELIAAGRLVRARERLEESLALRRSMADKRGMAVTLENLGEVALAQGDLERARVISDECASVAQALGFRLLIARSAIHAGIVALLHGEDGDAKVRLADALEHAVDIGDTQSVSDVLKVTAVIAARDGHHKLALQLWAAAEDGASYKPAYDPWLARELDAATATMATAERSEAHAEGAPSPEETIALAKSTLRDHRDRRVLA